MCTLKYLLLKFCCLSPSIRSEMMELMTVQIWWTFMTTDSSVWDVCVLSLLTHVSQILLISMLQLFLNRHFSVPNMCIDNFSHPILSCATYFKLISQPWLLIPFHIWSAIHDFYTVLRSSSTVNFRKRLVSHLYFLP